MNLLSLITFKKYGSAAAYGRHKGYNSAPTPTNKVNSLNAKLESLKEFAKDIDCSVKLHYKGNDEEIKLMIDALNSK